MPTSMNGMTSYEFTVVLSESGGFDEHSLLDIADRLFAYFEGDVNPAISSGQAIIDCALESTSLESAIRRVLGVLQREGMEPSRIELQAESLPAA
jgi:bisphosphoglycerate-dependent phosphoglycerate mutase